MSIQSDEGDDKTFIVEKIVKKRKCDDGQIKYLVKWQGWSVKDCTWEPPQNLTNVQYMVDEFEDKLKKSQIQKTTT